MVKKVLLILSFFFIFSTTSVKAATYTNIGYWNDYVDYGQFWFNPIPGSGDRYIILEKNDFIGNHTFSISNVYSMDLYLDNIPSQLQAQAGVLYELEFSMINAKFQNVNQVYVRSSNGGMQCSVTSFDNSSPEYPKIKFTCPSAYSSLQLSLYSSSLQSIFTTTSLRINYLYLRQYESSGTDTSLLESQNQVIINQNDTIINNQNSNTQDIIDNQNSNTQDIIDNQNSNTQAEIDSQRVCSYYDASSKELSSKYLQLDGTERSSSSSNYGISKYIPVTTSSKIKVITRYNESDGACFYNVNKSLISCVNLSSFYEGDIIPVPSNSSYFRFSILVNLNRPQLEICSNGNQALNDSVNNLNDSITSTDTPNTSQDIQDMDNMVASDTPISDLITMPLTLINAYINGVNSSCSPVNLGNLYGTNLILPCINLEQRLGSDLWSKIDALFSLFMCYNIGMLFITAFDGITSLRDDFEGLYQPRHADTGYQPKHGG